MARDGCPPHPPESGYFLDPSFLDYRLIPSGITPSEVNEILTSSRRRRPAGDSRARYMC